MKQLYYKVGLLLGIFKHSDFVKASQVITRAIEIYNHRYDEWSNDRYSHRVPGLCKTLRMAFNYYGINIPDKKSYGYGEGIHKILSKFNPGFLGAKYTHTNLMDHPNYHGSPCWNQYWWDDDAYYQRLNALNKLQRYYITHDILIKKSNFTTTI